MKSKVSSLIKGAESDNIKITYSDIKVSGFPLVWKVQLLDLKISLTDEIKANEFLSGYLSIIFNYKLTEARVNFDKSISFHDSRETGAQSYSLNALGEESIIDLKFEKPIFLLNNSELSTALKSLKINNLGFAVNQEQAEIFSISGVSFIFDKTISEKLDNINIKACGEYKSENSPFKFQNANISVDVDYATNLEVTSEQETNSSFEKLLNITKWESTFDGAALGFKGNVGFSRNKLPEGEIAVSMARYPDLIDIIVPEEFIVSGEYLKKLIARIVSTGPKEEAEGFAKFKIKLGVDGASVGNINLLQLGE